MLHHYLGSQQQELAHRAELAPEGTKDGVLEAKRELAKLPVERSPTRRS